MDKLTPRRIFLLLFLTSIALVGGGVFMAEAFRLAACPLCIIQRMLYMVLALAALGGFCLSRRCARLFAALSCALVAGTGAFVAGYQVWLQRFAPKVSCTAQEPWWESFVYWAGEKLPLLFEAKGLCADRAWTFLTLSIADWSLLFFLAFTLLSGLAFVRTYHRK